MTTSARTRPTPTGAGTALALALACGSTPSAPPNAAETSEPTRAGMPPPRAALLERGSCNFNRDCPNNFECEDLAHPQGQCVRSLSFNELMSWRQDLEDITVIVRATLVPVEWVCTTECYGQLALAEYNSHEGVSHYVKLVREKTDLPYECKRTRGRAQREVQALKAVKVAGRYDARRGAFIARAISITL